MPNFWNRRRWQTLQRSPRVNLTAGGKQIVVPFRPISAFLIIFLTLLSSFLFLRTDIFQVKALDFNFEELADEALVRQKIAEKVLARSIFFLNVAAVEQEIKGTFPTVSSVSFEKRWPDGLLIKVIVRKPLAIVEDKNQSQFLVDQEGLLFRQASKEPLPVIKLGEEFEGTVGLWLAVNEQGIASYLKTLDLVSAKGLETKGIYLRSRTIELRLAQTIVWLNTDESIDPQLELLTQILQRLKLNGRTPKSVDLRFSRPVVKL